MVYFASYFVLVFALGAFLGFFFGYLYRGKANARAAKAAATEPAPAATAEPSAELLGVPGLAPATAAALAGAGIATLADLRGLAGERLSSLAATLKIEDFALKRFVGLADLQSLPAVDGDLAQALVRIGVRNAAELAAENADRVQNKLSALHDTEGLPASVPARADVAALIAAAGG